MQNTLNWTTHTVSWFSKRHQAGELELRAPFQRNPVWSDKQKGYLIDTILRDFPVPELYIQESTDSEGNDRFVVVDGQQRLRACLEYLADGFGLDPKDSPKWADLLFSELTDAERKRIYNYPFVIRVLPEMPEPDLRAMFARLNRNVVALNAQEIRHATYWGEFITTVEKISDDELWTDLGLFTPNDVRRMLDIEFVSELTIALIHGLQNKKQKLEEWFQTYEKEFPQRRAVENTFRAVLSEIRVSIPNFTQTRWRKKSDFYTLFLILGKNVNLLPLSRKGRHALNAKLVDFGGDVDERLSNEGMPCSKNVQTYVDAVSKAASDLGSRRNRETVLTSVLSSVFK